MAYNQKNLLTRVIEIQNITLKHKETGATQHWIFENIIHPKYRISIATYNNYLAMNAKQKLKKLQNETKNI